MKFECAHDALVDVHVLQPNPKNPNAHPARQIELLAKIISYQGQRSPIVVSNRSGFIVKGHGRLDAVKSLGWAQAAVDYQDYENEAQEYADMIADNKIAELAEHDDNAMIDGIKTLGITDFELLGLDDFHLPEVIEPQCDEDEIPAEVDTRCKLGDVWTLGRHRLMCGDSTSIDAVDALMAGEKADMVFTDPPYGMNLNVNYDEMFGAENSSHKNTGNRFKKVEGDDVEYDPNPIFSIAADEYYIWGADYFYDKLPKGGSWIAWDKRDENLDRVPGNTTEFLWSKNPHRRVSLRVKWSGHHGMQREDTKTRIHPTQKPVQLIEKFFEGFGGKHKVIVDIYGGSGSTLIACEKTNRRCFMMELDPHYCDVILARWESYTGNKAVLNGPT